jgi:hypothetical protein
MKESTKQLLKEAEEICNAEDRSIEYMIEFMQDYANVDLECVMNYIRRPHKKERERNANQI